MTELKEDYARIQGERNDTNRVYTRKIWWTTVYLIVSPESLVILNGGFGKPQTFFSGTQRYDAYVSLLNALEDGLYHHERWWSDLAMNWDYWRANGKPETFYFAEDCKLYEKYSPMTWS
jgi:hypothetical protein